MTRLSMLGWASAFAGCIVGCAKERAGPATKAPVPMPDASAIPMALSSNYGFMSTAFVVGDVRAFMSNFDDSATATVPEVGHIAMRDSIPVKYAMLGKQLHIVEVRRASTGFRMDGRTVLDSGTFEMFADPKATGKTVSTTGRYWTRWRLTDDGLWLIRSDSLVESRTRK